MSAARAFGLKQFRELILRQVRFSTPFLGSVLPSDNPADPAFALYGICPSVSRAEQY